MFYAKTLSAQKKKDFEYIFAPLRESDSRFQHDFSEKGSVFRPRNLLTQNTQN